MRTLFIVLLLAILNFLLFPEIMAQQRSENTNPHPRLSPMVISAAANSSETSQISLDWTLGETLSSTLSHNEVHYTQGFNQPVIQVEWSTSSKPSFTLKKSDLQIYPNPTSNLLQIKLSEHLAGAIVLDLIDSHGNLLYQMNRDRQDTFIEVDVTMLPQGIYWLNISKPDEVGRQSYKIVKINGF